jgi:hypothetical protein
MSYIAVYEVPPVPTAPAGTDEWHYQDSARACHLAFLNPTDLCWFCGKPLPCVDLVMWSGVTEIWVHAACAIELGRHLVKDGSMAYQPLEACS